VAFVAPRNSGPGFVPRFPIPKLVGGAASAPFGISLCFPETEECSIGAPGRGGRPDQSVATLHTFGPLFLPINRRPRVLTRSLSNCHTKLTISGVV